MPVIAIFSRSDLDSEIFYRFAQEMDFLVDQTAKTYDILESRKICVAVSGGPDSLALLILAQAWGYKRNRDVVCVTVDHGLRLESANEAEFVRDFCHGIGIEHHILKWKNSQSLPSGKLENLAREARYELLKNFCHERDIDLLLTGHTLNDQLETYAMRKMSGSSPLGLAGMSRIRSISVKVKLLRPLLGFFKKQLENFLTAQNIQWKNDPMNSDDSFRRVLLRKQIASYGEDTIRAYTEEILHLRKIRHDIETNAVDFLKHKVIFSDFGHASLNYDALLKEAPTVQQEIIKRTIWNVGGKKYAPSISEEIISQILSGKINTIGRCFLKIKKNTIYVLRENRRDEPSFVLLNPYCAVFDDRFVLGSENDLSDCKASWYWEKEISGISCIYRNIGLPCIYRNNKIVFVHGIFCDSQMKINARFVQKVNLFDIFL
ncbi:MAG: tRNA lysidine(34) synthetase TilS [Holosporaceae bacterium]|jgi:tRNA(Ile)-lysidine synthase|nr:tRNA lysidine(34) synthetase TilS [Holosporaceae bacterium]